MEPLKQQRQLLRRDGLAHISDGDPGLAVHHGHTQVEGGAFPCKFGGIFQQIVNNLGDHIVVAQHQNWLIGNIRFHIQMPVIDFLFHGDQHPAHRLAHVEMIAVAQGIDGLQLADIQHPPHKAAETAALVGDDPQILLFILRRDGTVQNAVRIPGDGGHRGFQLVGDVGDELPALTLRLLQGLCHIIKGSRQLADLVLPAIVIHANVKITVGILPGGSSHLPDGLDLPHGGNGGRHKGDHQHHEARHHQQSRKGPPQIINGIRGADGEHRPQDLPGGRVHHGHAAYKLLAGINLVQTAPPGPGAVCGDLVHHR